MAGKPAPRLLILWAGTGLFLQSHEAKQQEHFETTDEKREDKINVGFLSTAPDAVIDPYYLRERVAQI